MLIIGITLDTMWLTVHLSGLPGPWHFQQHSASKEVPDADEPLHPAEARLKGPLDPYLGNSEYTYKEGNFWNSSGHLCALKWDFPEGQNSISAFSGSHDRLMISCT